MERVFAVGVMLVVTILYHVIGSRRRADNAQVVDTAGEIADPDTGWRMYTAARCVNDRKFVTVGITFFDRLYGFVHTDEILNFLGMKQQKGHD